MSRRAQENLVAAIILMVLIGVVVMSLDFGPRARMIPLPLAIFGIILIVAQIVWQNLRPADELQVDLLQVLTGRQGGGGGSKRQEEAASTGGKSSWRKEVAALGIVIALVALILLIGPIAAICLFTGGYFMLSRHFSPVMSIVYTLVFAAVVYLLFVVALEVQLYHGLLEPLVEHFR
jgi:hypothetical protein